MGDRLAGKDFCTYGDIGFADEVAIADGKVAVAQFDIVAGAGVIAYVGYLARQHRVYGGTGFSREVKAVVMFRLLLAERIPAIAKAGCDFQLTFQRWMIPVDAPVCYRSLFLPLLLKSVVENNCCCIYGLSRDFLIKS